jgi:hypothetical protein
VLTGLSPLLSFVGTRHTSPKDADMPPDPDRPLVQSERMQVFRALVEAQDRGLTVERSRRMVAKRFGLSEQRVREIEREGLDCRWPPLAP